MYNSIYKKIHKISHDIWLRRWKNLRRALIWKVHNQQPVHWPPMWGGVQDSSHFEAWKLGNVSAHTSNKMPIYSMQIASIMGPRKNWLQKKTEMPLPTLLDRCRLLSQINIYFLPQKALCSCSDSLLLYCKIDFFVPRKNCTANVTRGLTYEKPDIECYAPTFFSAENSYQEKRWNAKCKDISTIEIVIFHLRPL